MLATCDLGPSMPHIANHGSWLESLPVVIRDLESRNCLADTQLTDQDSAVRDTNPVSCKSGTTADGSLWSQYLGIT